MYSLDNKFSNKNTTPSNLRWIKNYSTYSLTIETKSFVKVLHNLIPSHFSQIKTIANNDTTQ